MNIDDLIKYIITAHEIAIKNPEYEAVMLERIKSLFIRKYLYSCMLNELKNNVYILNELCKNYTGKIRSKVRADFYESFVEILFNALLGTSEYLLEQPLESETIHEFVKALKFLSSEMKDKIRYDICMKQIHVIENQLTKKDLDEKPIKDFLQAFRSQNYYIKF